jgi:hypothetical protein
MMTRITGVALLSDDGRMWALPAPCRHFHLFALAAFQGAGFDPDPCQQGFTTDCGNFVSRTEAAKLVGINNKRGTLLDELYSEDLW